MTPYQKVEQFYQENFDQLSLYEQFHYASRLWLWKNDTFSSNWLKKTYATYLSLPEQEQDEYSQKLFSNPAPSNANNKRQHYLSTYPEIRGAGAVLFRALFFEKIFKDSNYANSLKNEPHSHFELIVKLLKNEDLFFTLSTFAINFIFLHFKFMLREELPINRSEILKKSLTIYNHEEPFELQLSIYLLTHLIIGESLFYTHKIEESYRAEYLVWVKKFEAIISDKYHDIHLDNKLEFIVASQLIGYTPTIAKKILDEAARSFSSEGDFIIDVENNFPQTQRTTFATSEHRNVLYIMASSHSFFNH